jgi:hypothetical protein
LNIPLSGRWNPRSAVCAKLNKSLEHESELRSTEYKVESSALAKSQMPAPKQ